MAKSRAPRVHFRLLKFTIGMFVAYSFGPWFWYALCMTVSLPAQIDRNRSKTNPVIRDQPEPTQPLQVRNPRRYNPRLNWP